MYYLNIPKENQLCEQTLTHTPNEERVSTKRHSWALGVTILEWLGYELVIPETETIPEYLEQFVESTSFSENELDQNIVEIARDCVLCNIEFVYITYAY